MVKFIAGENSGGKTGDMSWNEKLREHRRVITDSCESCGREIPSANTIEYEGRTMCVVCVKILTGDLYR